MNAPVHSHPAATQALIAKLGAEKVRTDEATCFAASFDNMRLSFMPEAVIRPGEEEDIGIVLKLANEHRVPVTVRGRGTGNAGASSPIKGGWVIHLDHWDKIEIDPISAMATVQPGAITAKINDLAAPFGLFFPPDPSSLKYCSIGGNIATNAGGLRAAKYGVVRDHVYALEGFLPTGEKVRWAAPLRKFVSGINIRDLWIGSEGTLGIITKAVLKLVNKPLARRTFLLACLTDEGALEAAAELMGLRINPSVFEFLDTQTVDAAEKMRAKRVFATEELKGNPETHALLLVEIDGHPAALADDAIKVREWISRHAIAFRETESESEAEALWDIRRTCSQAMYSLGNAKLNEDIVVPFKSYVALIRYTREVRDRTGLATPTFGHAADGNFHVHIMYNRDNPEHCRLAEKAIHEVMQKVVELGGAITGEHGIGIAKSPFLSLQHTPAEIQAMRAIKLALDPNGILAPGQIFEPLNVWDYRPVKVTLAWDKH